MQKTIFVVDDNDINLAMAELALEEQYRVMTLPSAAAMFELLAELTKEMGIPIHRRILAVADLYDALLSDRPYKKAFTEEEVIGIIMDNAGKQFDPYDC